MTEEKAGSGDVAGAAQGPRECMPCTGSGTVISHLGGTASKVTCPWCEGSGVRIAGVDAQVRWAGAIAADAGSEPPALAERAAGEPPADAPAADLGASAP